MTALISSTVAVVLGVITCETCPRRFVTTATGRVEFGTCDARIAARTTPDGKRVVVHFPPRPGDLRQEFVVRSGETPPVSADDQRLRLTCAGSPFRRYAAGRLATRNPDGGEIRVAFVRPCLSPSYRRVHYCPSSDFVYYLSSFHDFISPNQPHHLVVKKLPLDVVPRMPIPGHADAAATVENRAAIVDQLTIVFGLKVPDTLIPETASRTLFDIASTLDNHLYFYVLDGTSLVQYRHVTVAGTGVTRGGVFQSWNVINRYKTDLDGRFWVVQIAPQYFVVVDGTGRAVEFTSGPAGVASRELARSGTNVRITHKPNSASVVSDKYNFDLTPAGVTAHR